MNASSDSNVQPLSITTKWCMVYATEGLLILLGNSLTMVVFWRRKHILKRTTYLLINLAMADSTVGLSTVLFAATFIISNETRFKAPLLIHKTLVQVNLTCVAASILSLVCIALERVFAFVRPLAHRTTKTRYYYYAVCFVWLTAVVLCTLTALGVYVFDIVMLAAFISLLVYGTSLFVISISYVIIWWAISKRPAPEVHQRKQNRKVAVTLSAIALLSLVTFVPGEITLIADKYFKFSVADVAIAFSLMLVYGNSLLNPFVYVLKMRAFRNELMLLLSCKRRHQERAEETNALKNAQGPQGVTLVKFSSRALFMT